MARTEPSRSEGETAFFPFYRRAAAPRSRVMMRPVRAPPLFRMDSDRMTAAVPVISMSLPADRFAQDFGASFERFGFAMITDPRIDPALIEPAWEKTKHYFPVPEAGQPPHPPTGGGRAPPTP